MKIIELESRLRALEAKFRRKPVILYFGDGSTQEIRGPRRFLFHLYCELCSGKVDPDHAELLDQIRQCPYAEEPGGSRMVELIQSLQEQPDDELEEVGEQGLGAYQKESVSPG